MPTRYPLMTLERKPEAFSRSDWIFEIKHDGFRGAAYVTEKACALVSRKDWVYRRFTDLAASLHHTLEGRPAIIDGEIVCLDEHGRAQFFELMSPARGMTYYYAFDLLWLDGEDLRMLPLVERKARLREIVPTEASRLLYVDFIESQGAELYDQICALDLEGIVCKPATGTYEPARFKWVKVKNPAYSQLQDRGKLFNNPR